MVLGIFTETCPITIYPNLSVRANSFITIVDWPAMYLTKDEQAILDGEQGAGAQKAMELVTALGKIYGADSLVDITSAHLSGASYKTIGEGGQKTAYEITTGDWSSDVCSSDLIGRAHV